MSRGDYKKRGGLGSNVDYLLPVRLWRLTGWTLIGATGKNEWGHIYKIIPTR